MIKRYLSTLLFYNEKLVKNCVIGMDASHKVVEIIPLEKCPTETAHTLFYDGIISGELRNNDISLPDLNGQDAFLSFFKNNTLPIELNQRNHIVLWKNIHLVEWHFKSKTLPTEL
ncbi:MAG: hypothetical protein IAA73_09980 [Bacteroidetes bacterium]|uniref:Uncharacterized protein n=1 Tax=Candidatus Gallipaludibacter merdavium TaxID=2840839 RepID=A0A9D9HVD0_9BACT|nr:hypothetical protein [Candidatus Gallipaludibacter merdavium]